MENTGKVLFEDDVPQWYIALGERWIGPLTASDVYQKVLDQQITWAHYVWKPGQADWKRICDTTTFQTAVPHIPNRDVQKEVKNAAKPVSKQQGARTSSPPDASGPELFDSSVPRSWYLYYNDSQFGPFSAEEIDRFLRIGKIHGKVHIWRDGMENWQHLEEIELFASAVEESKGARKKSDSKPESKLDQRSAPRIPLVAKILMAEADKGESVIIGICRDVSVGGMQVLTDSIPANVGARIKMNVSPVSHGQGEKKFEPFVASGIIVRILEDGRGFSFRFDRLSDSSRRSIEDYIQAAG